MYSTGKRKLALTTLIVFNKFHGLDYIEMWNFRILIQVDHAFHMEFTFGIALNLY